MLGTYHVDVVQPKKYGGAGPGSSKEELTLGDYESVDQIGRVIEECNTGSSGRGSLLNTEARLEIHGKRQSNEGGRAGVCGGVEDE